LPPPICDGATQIIKPGRTFMRHRLPKMVAAHIRLFGTPDDVSELEGRIRAQLVDAAGHAEMQDAVAAVGGTVARVRADLDPGLAARLGIDTTRPITQDEIANLLTGLRTDGQPIDGKQMQKPTRSVADVFGLDEKALPSATAVDHVLAGRRADGEAPREANGAALSDKIVQGARRRFLAAYGMPSQAEPTEGQIEHIKAGRTVTGLTATAGEIVWKLNATKQPIAFVDMIFSADKSVSVAWALADTEAERSIFLNAHRTAVDAAMRYSEQRLGHTRRGENGDTIESGSIAWIAFDHYTSRPTAEIARTDKEGRRYTEFQEVPTMRAADMQLHAHAPMLNAVLTNSGHIGAMDLDQLDGLVKELGGVYQAVLGREMRRTGARVALDRKTGAAVLTDLPERVRTHYSKRSQDVQAAARDFANQSGTDWDSLSPEHQLALLRKGVEETRHRKNDRDGASDFVEWRRQAIEELDYRHQTMLRPSEIEPELSPELRHRKAYEVSLDLVEEGFGKRAVLSDQEFREFATRGLIEAGIGDDPATDIKSIMRMYRAHGVRQDGAMTSITFGQGVPVRGKERWHVTTGIHEDEEKRVIALARHLSADRSHALPVQALEKAKREFLASRPHIDPNGSHWKEQSAAIDRLGQGGRLGVAIGAAGVGKTTLMTPIITAAKAEGRQIYGVAIAWKTASALRDAGIGKTEFSALSPFLSGKLKDRLDSNSIVIVDELSQIGRRDMLRLMEMQARRGFSLFAIGDPKQAQAVESGPTISLLQQALGGGIPEILVSVRQRTEREQTIASLMRAGGTGPDQAIRMKREDATAELVAGGRDATIKRAAALWRDRMEARGMDPEFRLTVSAPTNRDAYDLSLAVRAEMRAMSRLGEDKLTVQVAAGDGSGLQLLPLAAGDKVRLFNRVFGPDKTHFGSNGDVVTVLDANGDGIQARNPDGAETFLGFEKLRQRNDGPIRLSYGYATTIDASQGSTSPEHIDALPEGSRAVNGLKGYVAESRHRDTTWMVVNEAAERRQIASRIPIGEYRPIRDDDIWNNVAENLGRQPIKASAIEVLKRSAVVYRGSISAIPQGLATAERRERQGQERWTAHDKKQRLQAEMSPSMQRVVELARGIRQRVVESLGRRGPEPGRGHERQM
jgi:hypothetical protein